MCNKRTFGDDSPCFARCQNIVRYLCGLSVVAFALGVLCAPPVCGDAVSLADAVDNHTFIWTADGDAPWAAQTTVQHDGVDAAQSGEIADNQTSVLRAQVSGPLTVSFCWRVSSQQDADLLRFSIDEAESAAISGETDWTRYTVEVGEGAHTLKWTYAKDAAIFAGSDCGWVDQVIINGRACVDGRNASGIQDGTSWSTAFTTIQAAVDAMAAAVAPATPGSATFAPEVWVAEGTYGPSGDKVVLMRRGVDLYGGFVAIEASRDQRDWRLHPSTLNGRGWFRCVVGADAIIDGFHIERGAPGMTCSSCSPVVRHCTFVSNKVAGSWQFDPDWEWYYPSLGGAMKIVESGAAFSECKFVDNSADDGAIVYNEQSESGPYPSFTNCLFYGNSAYSGYGGSGALVTSGHPGHIRMVNCTFAGNSSYSTAIGANYSTFANCIVWGNNCARVFSTRTLQTSSITYSDVQGGFVGEGNIDADPLFTDPDNGDFSLRLGSPCIDSGTSAGAPAIDQLGVSRPQGLGFDMGAYETLIQAAGGIEGARGGWFEENGSLTLTAAAAAFPGAAFQWTKDGVAIPGATSDTFQIEFLTAADSGWYGCQLSSADKYVITLPPVFIQVFPEGSLPLRGIATLACALLGAACLLLMQQFRTRGKRAIM